MCVRSERLLTMKGRFGAIPADVFARRFERSPTYERRQASSLLKKHDSDMSSPSMVNDVIPALAASTVMFIRTHVQHEVIPTTFIPLRLRTAAS